MSAPKSNPRSGPEAVFERKVVLSKWTLLLEQVWPRAWLLFGLAGLFMAVSLAGLWARLPELPHKIVLGFFGLALLAGLIALLGVRGQRHRRVPGGDRFRRTPPARLVL